MPATTLDAYPDSPLVRTGDDLSSALCLGPLAGGSGQVYERAKLERYLGSLETLRARETQLRGMAAQLQPLLPPARAVNPLIQGAGTPPDSLEWLEAQFEIATAALQGGLTHLAVLASGTSGFDARYPSIISGVGGPSFISREWGIEALPAASRRGRTSPGQPTGSNVPVRESHPHATFCWVELGTDDPAASKRFYGELFNWSFEDVPVAPGLTLTLCRLNGKNAALLRKRPEELRGTPMGWLSYIAVSNVDEIVTKMTANGGGISRPPADIPRVARMAVLTDPTGARLGLWQGKGIIGAEITAEPGALRFNELHTSKSDVASNFYVQSFGWSSEPADFGSKGMCTVLTSPLDYQHVGSILPVDASATPRWIPYFSVENVDASTEKVKTLGGKTFAGPDEIPFGRFAVVEDPQGVRFGLFTDAYGAMS